MPASPTPSCAACISETGAGRRPRLPCAARVWLSFLLLFLTGAVIAAETRLEVVDLQHRPADQMAEIVQPLLQQDEAVQAHGFQLILRARPDTIRQVRTLLQSLDRAPRRLRISVRHDATTRSVRRGAEAGARIGPDDSEVRARIYGTEARDDGSADQQLQVLEGNPAFIAFGQSVPVGERTVIIESGGATVHDGIQYRDVRSGFYVLPQVRGQRVHLRISPRREAFSRSGGGVVNVQQAETVVEGPLGQWIELGGTLEQTTSRDSGVVYRTQRRSELQARIEVKVEVLQ